jgi:hypothetical protein
MTNKCVSSHQSSPEAPDRIVVISGHVLKGNHVRSNRSSAV